ncbi:unnamed protein product, partial [Staurois parvus]
MGPLCPCPHSKHTQKSLLKKGTRGILWGPLLTPGPRAVPEFSNGQSAPEYTSNISIIISVIKTSITQSSPKPPRLGVVSSLAVLSTNLFIYF